MNRALRFKDRVAIVTGGASGIGAIVAETLSQEGAAVVLADINLSKAEQLAGKLQSRGYPALARLCDVTREADTLGLAREAAERFGRIDILVNNAGLWTVKKFIDMEPAEWDQDIKVCLYGTLHCTRAVLPVMLRQGYGRIVNISSDAGRVGGPNVSIYSAAKAAIRGFSQALAKEVGAFGITVNCVAPGFTETEAAQGIIQKIGRERLLRDTPVGRLAQPQDIVAAALFLASDDATFITGQTLSVNGGMLAF